MYRILCVRYGRRQAVVSSVGRLLTAPPNRAAAVGTTTTIRTFADRRTNAGFDTTNSNTAAFFGESYTEEAEAATNNDEEAKPLTASQRNNRRKKAAKARKKQSFAPILQKMEGDRNNERFLMTKKFMGFVGCPDSAISFPASLTALDRAFIHSLAKQAGLMSKSRGRGSKRRITVFKDNHPKAQKAQTRVAEKKEAGVKVNIGARGENALESYIAAHPPTRAELLESLETGSSLGLTAVAVDEIDFDDVDDVSKSSSWSNGSQQQRRPRTIDLERRERNHAMAQERKLQHPSYDKMQQARRKLPAWSRRQEIVDIVEKSHVMILAGETGCGKSTQIPQFILDQNPTASIAVTQPRRISAISVAERVAAEQCLGKIGGMVGYQIRLEAAMSNNTQVLFLTPGLLLRKLQSDPTLSEYTHIVIDEIHERDKHTEFLLIALKGILPKRPDLRVVLMSATMETDALNDYWNNAAGEGTGPPAQITIPGRTFPVQSYFLEDILAKNVEMEYCRGHNQRPVDLFEKQKPIADELAAELLDEHQMVGRDEERIDNHLILDILGLIDNSERGSDPGAVLIFLPGWQEISDMSRLLETMHPFSNKNKYSILPLHSGLSSQEQRKVFDRPLRGVRKIILSTNIAETSVTIDDISFVIDSGRVKEKSYDPELHTSTFGLKWVSQASAKQRKGRAGRVKEGVCFHMFSKERHDSLDPYVESELLRTPLEEMCLQTKQLGLAPGRPNEDDGLPAFLSRAMSPPPQKSVENAMEHLANVGAMDLESGELTSLGRCLSTLSLQPHVGKMVIYSHFLGCASAASALGVAMSHKTPFIMPPRALQNTAGEAHVELSQRTESDPISILFALGEFGRLRQDRLAADEFCRSYFLGTSTLWMMQSLRGSVSRELSRMRFPHSTRVQGYHNRHDDEDDPALWQAAIAAGMYPNVAFRMKGETNFLTKSNQQAMIHASSVNSNRGQLLIKKCKEEMEIVAFGEIVKGANNFTMNQTTYLPSPVPLILLCGNLLTVEPVKNKNSSDAILTLDNWLSFTCHKETASRLIILRKRLESAFGRITDNPSKGAKHLSAAEFEAMETLSAVVQSAYYESPDRYG